MTISNCEYQQLNEEKFSVGAAYVLFSAAEKKLLWWAWPGTALTSDSEDRCVGLLRNARLDAGTTTEIHVRVCTRKKKICATLEWLPARVTLSCSVATVLTNCLPAFSGANVLQCARLV